MTSHIYYEFLHDFILRHFVHKQLIIEHDKLDNTSWSLYNLFLSIKMCVHEL